MGAKFEMLAFAHQLPRLDLAYHQLGTEAEARFGADAVFPDRIGEAIESSSLIEALHPPTGTIYAGTFGDSLILVGGDVSELLDLPEETAGFAQGRTTTRLLMNSVVDAVAVEIWSGEGDTVRELMLTAEQGVAIDVGERLHFEAPFWSGQVLDDLHTDPEMPFHPMTLGEEALRTYFGFVLEAAVHDDDLDAFAIDLYGFQIASPPV